MQMLHFKTIMVAMVIIKQIVCIATTLIMWNMWILPEKEVFRENKNSLQIYSLNWMFISEARILCMNRSYVVAMVIWIKSA